MAIDSAEKRKSAANVSFWAGGVGVTPNSSMDVEWRQQAGWGYSGIGSLATPSVAVSLVFNGVAYIGRFQIDDVAVFYVNTHDPETGEALDADSPPTYRVYEAEVATPLVMGSMDLFDAADTIGFYSESITLSAANGFENGKNYVVYVAATVADHPGTTQRIFQVEAELAKEATVAALNDVSAAQVNAEINDVLSVDTFALPGQESPPLAPTFVQMMTWLYKVLRNRKQQTATQWQLLADDESTVDAKATVSDDGTTAVKQEIESGP